MYLSEQSHPVRWRKLGCKVCFGSNTYEFIPSLRPLNVYHEHDFVLNGRD